MVDGEQVFGVVHEVARGVLVNAMGPRSFGPDLETCRAIPRPN